MKPWRTMLAGAALAALCGCFSASDPDAGELPSDGRTAELNEYLSLISDLATAPADPELTDAELFGASLTTFEYTRNYEVVFTSPRYVSFRASEFAYTGGAHGGTTVTVGSIDRRTGRIVKLADLLPENRLPALTRVLHQAVVRQLGGEDELLGEVRPHDNFFIADDGLHFVFNEYEVACYAAGTIEVVIRIQGIESK